MANVDQLEQAWTYTTGNTIQSTPAVVNGVVYIGSNDGNLYALDATTGGLKRLNIVGTGAPIDYSSPAVANGVVYVGSTDGTRRPRTRPGPVATLDQIARDTTWVWAFCPSRPCLHHAAIPLPTVITRFGTDASSDRLRKALPCTACESW